MAVAARVERGRRRPGGLGSVRNVSLWDQGIRPAYRVCLFWFSRRRKFLSLRFCTFHYVSFRIGFSRGGVSAASTILILFDINDQGSRFRTIKTANDTQTRRKAWTDTPHARHVVKRHAQWGMAIDCIT